MSPTSEAELLALAHTLRNHLLVVQGNASLIQLHPGDPLEVAELARDIDEASRRANALVSRLQRAAKRSVDQPNAQAPLDEG